MRPELAFLHDFGRENGLGSDPGRTMIDAKGLLAGKRGLVMGVANDKSIA